MSAHASTDKFKLFEYRRKQTWWISASIQKQWQVTSPPSPQSYNTTKGNIVLIYYWPADQWVTLTGAKFHTQEEVSTKITRRVQELCIWCLGAWCCTRAGWLCISHLIPENLSYTSIYAPGPGIADLQLLSPAGPHWQRTLTVVCGTKLVILKYLPLPREAQESNTPSTRPAVFGQKVPPKNTVLGPLLQIHASRESCGAHLLLCAVYFSFSLIWD